MRFAALAILIYASSAHAAPSYVEAPIRAGALEGTMLHPKGSRAAILIIPGSGPTDRDGNNRLGIKGSPYKVLAESLAVKSVTTVRIDKRGMFRSAGAAADPNAITIGDYADDVKAWVKVIRHETGLPCVWVAGHSEGGLVALAASEKPEDICGLILLATPGRVLGEVLLDQLQAALGEGPTLRQAASAIQTLEAGHRPDMHLMHPALQQLFAPQIHGFLISMFSYDPAKLIAKFHKPILIIQGERDLQVSVEDAKRLKEAAPAAKLVVLPDTNHVLKMVKSADMNTNMASYTSRRVPLATGLAEQISEFVLAAR